MLRRVTRKLVRQIGILLGQMEGSIASRLLPQFANNPANLIIDRPRRISHPEVMSFGDDVYLGPNSLLVGVVEYPGPTNVAAHQITAERFQPRINIGHRVNSTGGLQVAACASVEIGDDVLFATNVNITDAFHGYGNVEVPFKSQSMQSISPIRIGRGSWIGQNVVILPGANIGDFAIVGANSVVTDAIPDRCIAVGAPARVIKRWNENSNTWLDV